MNTVDVNYDPIQLEVFKHLFASVADEMGVVLRRSSYSPNIKERRDFSCALFNPEGEMIAQAAHIPVHLGSMPLSVQSAVKAFPTLRPGDMVILNDPFKGGTHLPDITIVSPVYTDTHGKELLGFVASRAHHSDVGGIAPGSMPIAREIFQEGLIIPPLKLYEAGTLNESVYKLILANVRTPKERSGDLWAQMAANRRGEQRFKEIAARYGSESSLFYMGELLSYAERMTRRLLAQLPDGVYTFADHLDDDGFDSAPVRIQVAVKIEDDRAVVDFSGSAPQQKGSVNAVYAITLSAVYYVIRCLVGEEVPNNSGSLRPVAVIAPENSVVNSAHPAPVAGGNVETSQRIVDVLLGAFSRALPQRIPAASQGTMNNVTIGGVDRRKPLPTPFTYYETIGGGMGARPNADGPSAIHSHMTNTLNTPIEALEYEYPLRAIRYEVRQNSGGNGKFSGGDGIRRDIQILEDVSINLITDRRRTSPYGLSGGDAGATGSNVLIRDGQEIQLPGKGAIDLKAGDILSIRTPGGGGFGKPDHEED